MRNNNGGNRGPRTSVTIGDVILSTEKGSDVVKQVERDGQKLDTYGLKVYIPDDVDQAGIGKPSLVLTKDQYINFRVLSEKEVAEMPEWKRKVAQLKAWINFNNGDKK